MISKKNVLSALLLSLFFSVFSQVDKSNYALLWEVSGKDLPEKSWLFGSMHVRDVRAFEFPDSVLLATEQADAFAMEVHPDEMVDFVLQLFTTMEQENMLRDMLSEEAYQRLDELVQKKEGKPIDSLDIQDPFWIEIMLSDFDEPENTDKRDSPVDLYFYKLFHLNNKATFGLEQMRDYQNLTYSFYQMFEKETYIEDEATEDIQNQQFERMLDIYRRGDLRELEGYMKSFAMDQAYEYEMLGSRNIRMVESFLDIARQQSLFGVVGAAHLPGKDGMVELLRQQGYRVRRVVPHFTGLAERFEMPESSQVWQENHQS